MPETDREDGVSTSSDEYVAEQYNVSHAEVFGLNGTTVDSTSSVIEEESFPPKSSVNTLNESDVSGGLEPVVIQNYGSSYTHVEYRFQVQVARRTLINPSKVKELQKLLKVT